MEFYCYKISGGSPGHYWRIEKIYIRIDLLLDRDILPKRPESLLEITNISSFGNSVWKLSSSVW